MKRRLLALVPAAVVAGCTVGPDYRTSPVLSGAAPPPVLLAGREGTYAAGDLPPRWWRLYDDPLLDRLIDKALTRNTDLRVALATLQQADAQLRAARRQRTPQTTLTVDPTFGQASGIAPVAAVYDIADGISYDLDLFGRLRRSIEVASADVGAAQGALDLARVNVAGMTAGTYASACSAGLQIAVTNRTIAITRRTLFVTQRRFSAGIIGINDVVRARTLVQQTEATLPSLLAQQRNALFTLATLTGDPPETIPAGVAGCAKPPLLRRPIPIGDGASLLARRPDVRQAERRLAGAVAQVGVSTADLYPSVTIGGGLGTTAASLSELVSRSAFHWNFGPLLSWNFPNRSIARAQVVAANAQARGALASFDGTVLTALRETESSLTTLARLLDTERSLTLARDDAAIANANVERLYRGGVGDFLDTLDAERTLIGAENDLASATAEVAQDQINLFMALGGGWQEAPDVQDVPLERATTRGQEVPHRTDVPSAISRFRETGAAVRRRDCRRFRRRSDGPAQVPFQPA